MATEHIDVLFGDRFLDKHAGPIITDTAVALIELVANSWDAYASTVDITWPDANSGVLFEISDDGKGMTREMFEHRWSQLDYDRGAEEGPTVEPPADLTQASPRVPYGRNGRGRHGAFRFADPYRVTTWRDGTEVTFEVRRGTSRPFDIELVATRDDVEGHGTTIRGLAPAVGIVTSAEDAREILGSRFLADPNFKVSVDGTLVTFGDLPKFRLKEIDVSVAPYGTAHLTVVDADATDRATKQHGIAWWVNMRLVGTPSWSSFDQGKMLDGRTREAKRFQIIVRADFLADAVQADWTGFDPESKVWQKASEDVHAAIREFLAGFNEERRDKTKAEVRERLAGTVQRLSPIDHDRWSSFVDQVVDTCPTISAEEVKQVAGILANLEISQSKYGLINRLHEMGPGDFDQLNQLLIDWNVRTAKLALDEIQSRLKLIAELDSKLRDDRLDEVGDLQPLFDRSLWVFGPEFESLEFTSNKGMTEVIQKLLGSSRSGSRLRPDYVILPDGSMGFYSRDQYDADHEVNGVERLVVAEIKRVGVPIGSEQKNQAWKYVKELIEKGLITKATQTTCFVLGSRVEPAEASERKEWDDRVVIRPMSYEVFIKRASARMLGLRDKLKDAPFLKEQGVDTAAFVSPVAQPSLFEETV
jgi:hypothetical protein